MAGNGNWAWMLCNWSLLYPDENRYYSSKHWTIHCSTEAILFHLTSLNFEYAAWKKCILSFWGDCIYVNLSHFVRLIWTILQLGTQYFDIWATLPPCETRKFHMVYQVNFYQKAQSVNGITGWHLFHTYETSKNFETIPRKKLYRILHCYYIVIDWE